MTIWEWLTHLDAELFTWIHARAAVPALDGFMKLMREPTTWIPLYAFMIYWIIRYHPRYAWQFILFTLITFAITDYVSASVLKPLIGRLRPCYNPDLQPILRNLVGCGGRYGMPSSHASNHFGLATFWFCTIWLLHGKKWHWLWFWAALICYAQVYVGKHYPLDILVGTGLGMLTGYLCSRLFRRLFFRPATDGKS